jgi:hypothetical protein
VWNLIKLIIVKKIFLYIVLLLPSLLVSCVEEDLELPWHVGDKEVWATLDFGHSNFEKIDISTRATLNEIAPFVRYFQELVANEIYNDYLFVTRRDENVWWYDGQLIDFRTPNYAKLLRLMQSSPRLTLDDMKDELGISMTAVRKLVNQLVEKNYVEKNDKECSWRVIITPSV